MPIGYSSVPTNIHSLERLKHFLPSNSHHLSLLNSNSNSLNSSTTHLHFLAPLSPLPSPSSIHQIKQAHAHFVSLGLAGDGTTLGRLLAAISLSPSPPSIYARAIFDSIQHPNIFARNNIIRCYAKSDIPQESLVLYSIMLREKSQPNNYTFPFLLQACSKVMVIAGGTQIHTHIVKLGFVEDVYIRNALIHFYSACGEMDGSRRVFDESPNRDIVTWNAILSGYGKDGLLEVAEKLFDEMPDRDVISWSSMIMGYVQCGQLEKGLELFREMREKGLFPNEATLVTVLSASAQLGLLGNGQLVHSTIKELKCPQTVAVGTALVDMYAKCGSIELSRKVFVEMPKRDVFAWNAMICGLATHGLGCEALELFRKFIAEGLCPVSVTFVGVLSACSHAGLVDEGRKYFRLMTKKYGIKPEMEHYGCMVDLLGRAGLIIEALDLIEKMTNQPDPVLWGMLLGACKTHGLVEVGETIGKKVIEMDPTHDGHYVLLSGIYASKNRWEDVIKVRRLMLNQGANKAAGWSLIEAQGMVHRFVAGDREHERCNEIHEMLDEVGKRLEKAGYTPNVSSVLHDIGEEEKEHVIREHSERLAIAFGLLVTEIGGVIRVVKNLRVCVDCHEVSKILSTVFGREIIVRDGSRFHHFKEGRCSCLDYW